MSSNHQYLFVLVAIATVVVWLPYVWGEVPASRYFYHGDGRIKIRGNGITFQGNFRDPDGTFSKDALKKINKVFGAGSDAVSPRLIEFFDYLEDNLKPGSLITIASGYRSPEYNMHLRTAGKLAAKASLHQYGMAADLKLAGVSPETIWNFIKDLGFGGAGYYHGGLVHVDVGPARFWDETTSKVDTDISDDNKLIGVVTDRDIYLPGELLKMRFIRMTAFPIGVERSFQVEHKTEKDTWKTAEKFAAGFGAECSSFNDIPSMTGISWKIPENLKPGLYRIRAKFCNREWEAMPAETITPEFEVSLP